jgi:hypothetical protein|tara:strand:+ start:482 stop:1108 length:627 start_codon:yes stop_codon:yes gene_type:complete
MRINDTAILEDGKVNVIAESLPSSNKRVSTKVQLIQKADHYVGGLLQKLQEKQEVLALGPVKPTPDGVLVMQPMLVISQENFSDILAVNAFMACGGLGPKQQENEVGESTVTNRSIAWQTPGETETNWFKLTAWNELSGQLSELPNGTPTIAVGRVSTSEKDQKQYLNYQADQILYLPKGTKSAPKKAADPEKGQVAAAALGSINFAL